MRKVFLAAMLTLFVSMAFSAQSERKQLFDANWSFSQDSIQWTTVNLEQGER